MQHTGHTAYMQDLSDFASTHRSTRCNLQPLEPLKHLDFDLMPHRTSCFSLFVSVCCVWIQFRGLSDCLFDMSMICAHSQSFIYYFHINSHLPREKKDNAWTHSLGRPHPSMHSLLFTYFDSSESGKQHVWKKRFWRSRFKWTVKNWVRVSNSRV